MEGTGNTISNRNDQRKAHRECGICAKTCGGEVANHAGIWRNSVPMQETASIDCQVGAGRASSRTASEARAEYMEREKVKRDEGWGAAHLGQALAFILSKMGSQF